MESGPVRERILDYLRRRSSPAPAAEVLRAALGIHSPGTLAADKVLRSLVAGDPRFVSLKGAWTAAVQSPQCSDIIRGKVAALHIQISKSSARQRICRGALCLLDAGHSQSYLFAAPAGETDTASLRKARTDADGCPLAVWGQSDLRQWNRWLRALNLPDWQEDAVILSSMARGLVPRFSARAGAEDLAALLGLAPPDEDRPAAMARFFAEAFLSLLEHVPAEARTDVRSLARWLARTRPKVDFSRFGFGPEFLLGIPERPGVYIMRNRAGNIIYVGKSDNLRSRVRSYFTARALKDAKITRIHEQLYTLEYSVVASEVEALILEMQLIRDFQPQINLQTEVHEKPVSYGKPRNLLILVQDEARQGWVTIYLVRSSMFVGKERARLGRQPGPRLKARIQSAFFARRGKGTARAVAWEREITSRWLAFNLRRLNALDVDEAGSRAAVMRLLEAYLKDPDRLASKVYYR